MIDRKYQELINKEIDKTISPAEKETLDKYLKSNPEADLFYHDLLKTESLLDNLSERDPSVSLKPRILNSLDYNYYSNANKKFSLIQYIPNIFSNSKTKIAASFAVLAIAVVIILLFYFPNYENTLEVNNTIGTIGFSNSTVVESFNVNSNDISGKVDVLKGENLYAFDINLTSLSDYIIQIQYDNNKIHLEESSLPDFKNVHVEKSPGLVKITGFDSESYALVFKIKELLPEKVTIQIFQKDKRILEKEILLSKD